MSTPHKRRPKQKNISDFSSHKFGTRELNRSYEMVKPDVLNGISVPPNTKKGFMAPVDAHQIKKEDNRASKKRRSPLSSTDEEEEDDGDFRTNTKPEDTLKVPKKTGSSSKLHTPAGRNTSPSSGITTCAIFDSISSPNAPQAALRVPKKVVNPFASNGLKLPVKKKAKMDDEELERMKGSLVEGQKDSKREQDEDQRKCDFCGEQLWPITEPIRKALEEFEKKNAAYVKQQNRRYDEMQAASSFATPTGFMVSRPVSNDEKDKFCKLHRIQLVIIPEGIRKGYPRYIDFSKIQERIPRFSTELEEVIRGVIHSDYKEIAEKAYREQGQTKARSVMSLLNRFTATLPGYYGPRGAGVILKVLTKTYIDTGYMRKHLKSSQLPLEYLQQVLVPEVGFRLIRQDMQKGKRAPISDLNQKAKAIMKESAAYGSALFPIEDADIDDDRVSSINYNHEDEGDQNDDDDEVEINEVYAVDSD